VYTFGTEAYGRADVEVAFFRSSFFIELNGKKLALLAGDGRERCLGAVNTLVNSCARMQL